MQGFEIGFLRKIPMEKVVGELMCHSEAQSVEFPFRASFHQRVLLGIQIDAAEIDLYGRIHTILRRQVVKWNGVQTDIDFKKSKNINRGAIFFQDFEIAP